MTLRRIALGTLALATALSGAAFADRDHDDGLGRDDRRHEDRDRRGEWGRYEVREIRRVVPAVTREEWVPERREVVVIPAVTEEIRTPAVVVRVWRPAVVERTWVPEVRERVRGAEGIRIHWHGHDVDIRAGVGGCDEYRVVRPAHWEERCVSPAHYEDVVVRPARCETRIVVPERREVRVVERACVRTVVVCAERVEVTCERVWVPGRYENGREHRGD